ncbi:MAG TPA: PA0069 family radical SAM protein [Devosia sp.]|nr:PA0069 family radical SAM protein [Devosia sp.]
MGPSVAPSFEAIERLASSRDADVLHRPVVDPRYIRGRGAQSNRSGRFETNQREVFDDGWSADPVLPFETVEHVERARSIITRNSSPDLHFERSITPYRGCAHGCSYCYARPTHAYLGHSAGIDFERDIYVKTNAVELLRRELSRARYRPKLLAIGTNTDAYQPLERKHKIMRGLLKVLLETRHPVAITTKSALVIRDLDLLTQLAKDNLVSVAISVTSMDRKLSRWMEPRASAPAKRLEAIRLLCEAGIPTHVLAAPMIPAINDMELERILEAAASQGAVGANFIMLRLPGEVKDIFREWLLRYYPNKVSHVLNLIREVRGGRENDPRFGTRMRGQGAYAVIMEQRFERVVERLGLSKQPPVLRTDLFCAPEIESNQLSLF